ncbi:MAG: division/cell wall cluster transcriptional repressor MraZ [Candidatus Competibacterales bacterium]|nr:division/cell wall cluster transcriptional repressor MraZ [Candidatus Competibacterales bacterium]
MFRGISPLSLDAKGRMSIPSRYRPRLQSQSDGQLILTVDPDHCLLLYPLPEWEEVEQRLIALSSTNRRARGLKRLLLGHAEECALDASGRVLLPAPLREFAGIERRVVLVGQGIKFEVWDEATWYKQREDWIDAQHEGDGSLDLDTLTF